MASLLGTTFGDFVSIELGLGFEAGLLPLGLVLALVFMLEKKSRQLTEAYYWTEVVLMRTMATNLADLATHQLKLNYGWLEATLVVLLVAVTALRRRAVPIPQQDAARRDLPPTDVRYWAAMLIVSVMGTSLGDFVADDLGLGVAKASIVLVILLLGAFTVYGRLALSGWTVYWVLLIVVRTAGTTMGDFLSGDEGLNLGFALSAASVAALLVALLRLWPDKRPAAAEVAQMGPEPMPEHE